MKRNNFLLAGFALFSAAAAFGQTLAIPQIADGGGWQTTIVLTNTSSTATTASLTFFQDSGGSGGATQNWNLTLLEVNSGQNLSLAGAGTIFLHTPGTAANTTTGWAKVQANASVVAYAIFSQRSSTGQTQEGTANGSAGTSRVLIPFDNMNGFVTSVAMANPNSLGEAISVGIQLSSGAASQPSAITLAGQGHLAFALPDQFPATKGQTGLLELSNANGSVAALALRFDPSGAFTTAPVYSGTGASIIGGGGGYSQITITPVYSTGTQNSNGSTSNQIVITSQTGTVNGAFLPSLATPSSVLNFSAGFSNVAISGASYTLTGVAANSTMTANNGTVYTITDGSVAIMLLPSGTTFGTGTVTGRVTGTFSLVSAQVTISGTITGSFTAN